MTKISNFKINTKFTALKQINKAFVFNISYPGGTLSKQLNTVIASAFADVPAGAYVEIVSIKSSLDGNTSRLVHEWLVGLDPLTYINFAINQTSNSRYEFTAAFTTEQASVTVPAFTAQAILRLSEAPFEV